MTWLFRAVLFGGAFLIPFAIRAQEPALPSHDLTVREIIEMIADYDVKHVEQQPFYRPAYGVTNFESSPPAVWIFNTGDTMTRRSTVIHELLHIHYHQMGLNPPEDFIGEEELRLYVKVFGVE